MRGVLTFLHNSKAGLPLLSQDVQQHMLTTNVAI